MIKKTKFYLMVVYEVLKNLWESTVAFLPNVIAALILLLIGWTVGWVVGKITKDLLNRLKVDEYVFRGGKPIFRLSNILPIIFSWFIYLAFIQSAVQVLGITALVVLVDHVISFLPGLVGAIIVVVVGYAIAEYVRQHVEESGVSYSDIIAKVLFFFVLYIAVAMALPLVKIDPSLINNILLIIVGSFGAGVAIAIGLGLKDTVAELAKKYRKRLK
jgi:hypothetical protein